MGQTLTHGIYLPDEGERNCYNGLAGNWQLLDGAVGTIAEHSTQIAGKAPAVHTHVKADITDFPAYGNAAGTICEGNDSRLSDARTPVAHTHGKADITDLFNSANEWTDLQSYTQSIKFKVNLTIGAAPSSELYGGFNFGNTGTNIGNVTARVSNAGATYTRLYIGNKFANGALDPNGTWKYAELQVGLRANGDKYLYTDGSWRNNLLPLDNNTYDLGSSSYQWNNLYAKNYYYNGTAWGLDKANTWSNINTYQSEICISGDRNAYIAPMWEGPSSGIAFLNSDASKTFVFGQHTTDANNRKAIDSTKGRLLIRTGERNGETVIDFEPRAANAILGTSTNKWKSLNGVNPGALSIFNPSAIPDPISFPNGVNESGTWKYDGSAWNALDVSNIGDGWIIITYNACAVGDYILARFGGTGGSRYPSMLFKAEILAGSPTSAFVYAFFPVAKAFGNIYLEMKINSNAHLVLHHFMPAYGTV